MPPKTVPVAASDWAAVAGGTSIDAVARARGVRADTVAKNVVRWRQTGEGGAAPLRDRRRARRAVGKLHRLVADKVGPSKGEQHFLAEAGEWLEAEGESGGEDGDGESILSEPSSDHEQQALVPFSDAGGDGGGGEEGGGAQPADEQGQEKGKARQLFEDYLADTGTSDGSDNDDRAGAGDGGGRGEDDDDDDEDIELWAEHHGRGGGFSTEDDTPAADDASETV
jgi:hypothetical protein